MNYANPVMFMYVYTVSVVKYTMKALKCNPPSTLMN